MDKHILKQTPQRNTYQQREVPWDDLTDHTNGLMQADTDGVLVMLGDGSLLSTDDAGEVAEVINGQGQVGRAGLTDGLAVVHGLGHGQQLEVSLQAVRNLVQDGTKHRSNKTQLVNRYATIEIFLPKSSRVPCMMNHLSKSRKNCIIQHTKLPKVFDISH
jgi:hypothetical protein